MYVIEMWLYDVNGQPWGPFWVAEPPLNLTEREEDSVPLDGGGVAAAVGVWLKNRPLHKILIRAVTP